MPGSETSCSTCTPSTGKEKVKVKRIGQIKVLDFKTSVLQENVMNEGASCSTGTTSPTKDKEKAKWIG
eukprot:scaffold342_cov208-Ochromonas_danica.AAC.9